ncbi:hypothetical protein WJX81_001544 [Elliptochloris bilobata]|uniref:GDSL esterase/lipase n=1 Tax=Elliptochloris bilobata TaxID=381761 RepID=A0AAW1SLB0_9CHLO
MLGNANAQRPEARADRALLDQRLIFRDGLQPRGQPGSAGVDGAYEVVSTCSQLEPLNGTERLTRWHVVAMNATLAVRPNAAAVETARNGTARRVAGATALDVGATLALNGTNDMSVLPSIFTGIVHAVPCSAGPSRYNVYNYTRPNATYADGVESSRLNILLPKGVLDVENQTIVPYMVDPNAAQSVAIWADNTGSGLDYTIPVACCTLTPAFPDLPDEHSETIEANIVNQNYTFVAHHTFSRYYGAERYDIHSYHTEMSAIQNTTTGATTLVRRGDDEGDRGACETRDYPPDMNSTIFNASNYLLAMSEFLRAANASVNAQRIPGTASVRGITCERWIQALALPRQDALYNATFYFPVLDWAVARENYRRQLKRIHITGFLRGEAIDHYYDYINMRPRHFWRHAFDVCAIAPKGQGCNCDPSAVEEGWRGYSEMRRRPPPRGFIREQKGPYAVLSVCGFLLGALAGAALLAMVVALRRRRRSAAPHAGGNGFMPSGGYSPGEHTRGKSIEGLAKAGQGLDAAAALTAAQPFVQPAKPYYNYIYSNGPNYAMQVAAATNLTLVNYAIGGATSGLSASLETSTNQAIQALLNAATMKAPCPLLHGCYNLTFVGAKIPSLLDQVDQYLADAPYIDPQTPHFIDIGGNDILALLLSVLNGSATVNDVPTFTQNFSVATKKVVDKLYGAGVRRFFVMGAPPLHDAPTMRVMAPSLAASDLGRLAALGLQTSLDAQTQALVDAFPLLYPASKAVFFPLNSIFLDAKNNKARGYGFTNTLDACYNGAVPGIAAPANAAVCGNPDEYIYWDKVHPTHRFVELLVPHVLQAVQALLQ